jgi:hypothetical protein
MLVHEDRGLWFFDLKSKIVDGRSMRPHEFSTLFGHIKDETPVPQFAADLNDDGEAEDSDES